MREAKLIRKVEIKVLTNSGNITTAYKFRLFRSRFVENT
jgi:hypothetical protein